MKKIIISLALLFVSYSFVQAENLEVGTIERTPFSYQDWWEWTGFSIDLWKAIAQENNLEYSFIPQNSFSEILSSTENNDVDLSVANISITLEREKKMDFSQPIFDSWLNILAVRSSSELWFSENFFTNNPKKILIYILIWLVWFTHFFWILNVAFWNIRLRDYFPDIFMVSYEMITQYIGRYGHRILFISIIGISVFTVSYYSQKVTIVFANYEDEIIESNLSEYKDLSSLKAWNIKVGVTKSSTSEKYLKQKRIKTKSFDSFENMKGMLLKWEIEVIVHDDPLLRYLSQNDEKERFSVVSNTFNPEKFGIAFPEKSELRETIDRTILKLRENWEYERIYDKYF